MSRFLDEPIELRTAGGQQVVLRRSAKRRRTVSAFWENGNAVIAIPATLNHFEAASWARKMLPKLERPRTRARTSDADLIRRATELSRAYLGGKAVPASVRWVDNQRDRWGSTTPAHGTVRLSSALRGMPDWVVDYVLLHELAHLLVAGHGPDFWALLTSYPRTETAKAFLSGVSFATTRGLAVPGRGAASTPDGTRFDDVDFDAD